MNPPYAPTLDLTAGTPVDRLLARYDAAWHEAILSGGPAPDREETLALAGADRDRLAALLGPIDGAYHRLRELIQSGAATLGPRADTKPTNSPAPGPGQSAYAETLDSFPSPAEPLPAASHYPETLDSVPAADAADSPPTPEPDPLPDGSMVDGYELLGAIAHGGMGVVYKARHRKLDRLAAIKMVLAGAHASPERLARFRAEAQVVARLQHPSIVQLYEVGEHDGLPYIALEFVEGGSLAHKAGGQPQPPRDAAAAVEVLARAMDYAHHQGVVHRDLKPANILLRSDGAPKVTDFGLAKRLEGDSGQTRSGTLMGTPSYMAPEQAAGWVHEIGPQTDVWALGAILYELLTGVPPFGGKNPLEIVVAVLKNDPVAPSRLQPRVPKDLETICLKCLEKEKPKRYASAAELADDLRRFLAGEAIRARPVGRAERCWRWCRRNPGIASLAAAVLLLLTTVAGVSTAAAVRVRAEKQAADGSAAAAREAQSRAEGALAEAERQKGIAEQKEAAAVSARAQAESSRAAAESALKQTRAARDEAEKARKRADDLATVASAQRELALDALGGLIIQVQNKLDDAPGTQEVKRELLELALAGLKKVAPSTSEAAVVDIRMAEGYRRLGDLAQRLGDLDLARQSYEHVERVVAQQLKANPRDPVWMRASSIASAKLGDLATLTGDRPAARRHYEAARKLREELVELGGENSQSDLAQVCVKLGNVSNPTAAVELYKESLRLRELIVKEKPRDGAAARDVRVSHSKLADGYLQAGDAAAALTHAQRAAGIADALAKLNPKSATLNLDQAMARAKLGDAYRAGKRGEDALKQYAEAVKLIEPVAAGNPRDLTLQVTHALFLAHAGRHAEAAKLADRVRGQAPKNAFLLYNAACAYAVAAEAARDGGEKPPAEQEKLAAGYEEAALAALKAALAAGFADHDLIRADPELAGVRKLEGFAEVAKGLRPVKD